MKVVYIPDKLIDGGIYILLCIESAANFIVLVNIFRVVCIPVLLLGQWIKSLKIWSGIYTTQTLCLNVPIHQRGNGACTRLELNVLQKDYPWDTDW